MTHHDAAPADKGTPEEDAIHARTSRAVTKEPYPGLKSLEADGHLT